MDASKHKAILIVFMGRKLNCYLTNKLHWQYKGATPCKLMAFLCTHEVHPLLYLVGLLGTIIRWQMASLGDVCKHVM